MGKVAEQNTEVLIAALREEVRGEFADLREKVILLREHSARRNGYVESINNQLADLRDMVASRPCEDRGRELEKVRLSVALLEKDEGGDKKRWERVTDVTLDAVKYIITFVIGALITWLLTGRIP